jgi:hypothetical protein
MTDRKEPDMTEQTEPNHPSPTTEAVAAAHDAPMRVALDSVRWVRRGILGRLTREA